MSTEKIIRVMAGTFVLTGTALAFLTVDGTEEWLRAALRLTARWSYAVFLTAYCTGALVRGLHPDRDQAPRRGAVLGLRLFMAFAAAHIVVEQAQLVVV